MNITDEQRKEALKWTNGEIRFIKKHWGGGGESASGPEYENHLGCLHAILSALEPRTVSREWREKWGKYNAVYGSRKPFSILDMILNDLGVTVKEDK